MNQPYLTTGELAKRFGISTWKVRRLFERGLLPPPRRAGSYRVVAEDDVPRIEDALRDAGYLPEPEPAGSGASS